MFEHFQKHYETMVSNHGRNEEDVKELIHELRSYPLITSQLWQETGRDLTRLLSNQRFRLDFEWD